MPELPGGPMAKRPLHFIFIADCSGSMMGDKIQSLNFAIDEAIPAMRSAASENPNAEVFVKALKFSSGATWHISAATPVESFTWTKLEAGGVTDMGKAMGLLAEQLKTPPMPERGLPPVLVLLSDGMPTDDFSSGLRQLMEQQWAKRAVRIAIAIGQDANHDVLQKFIGNVEFKPLQANNSPDLVNFIRWASTAVLKAASAPSSKPKSDGKGGAYVDIPTPPAKAENEESVW